MFARFLLAATAARTPVYALALGLSFAPAAVPSDAPAVLATPAL